MRPADAERRPPVSEPYVAWLLLPRASPAAAAIDHLHALLLHEGATQDEDCMVLYGDADEERDPEPYSNEARARLRAWSGLGGLTYWHLHGSVSVFFPFLRTSSGSR